MFPKKALFQNTHTRACPDADLCLAILQALLATQLLLHTRPATPDPPPADALPDLVTQAIDELAAAWRIEL